MRPIPKQYISKDDYPTVSYLDDNEEDRLRAQINALELQYDRWVEDLLDRIEDLEHQLKVAVDTLEDNFGEG